MTPVTTNQLPLLASSPLLAVGPRPKDDTGPQGRDDWQRALVFAAQDVGSSSSAASLAAASRLFDLNAVMAAPIEELAMAPSMTELAVSQGSPGVDREPQAQPQTQPHENTSVESSPAQSLPRVPPRFVRTDGRPLEATEVSNTGAHSEAGLASLALRRAAPSKTDERPAKAASTSPGPVSDDARSAALAFATPVAGPEQAIAAYAQAMSTQSVASDTTTSFTLVSEPSIAPVRVHVQWRGRLADVWIGLHRRAFDQLPDIRAGVQDWVSSHGGVVARLVCNGERLEGAPTLSSFPGAI